MDKLTREKVEQIVNEIQEKAERAKLSGAILFLANRRDAHLFLGDLKGPRPPWEDCKNLTRADLSGTERANLSGVDLSGVDLSKVDLVEANLIEANLSRANLSGANLSRADLYRANLTEANLIKANLSEANLSGVNFYGADLREANLSEADLTMAHLHMVDVNGANFNGVIVGGTEIRDIDLGVIRGIDTVKHIRPSYVDVDAISNLSISDPSVDFDEIPKVQIFLQRAGVEVERLQLYPWPIPRLEVEEHWLNSKLFLARARLKQLQENRAALEDQQGYLGMDSSLPLATVLKLNMIEIELFRATISNLETKLSNLRKSSKEALE